MSIKVIQGDVRNILPSLPENYFDCIVTSPPYYGLRDYLTATWDGGNAGCDHVYDRTLGMRASTLGGGKESQRAGSVYRDCPKCGARRIDAQIGLEPTLDEYLNTMVGVCRELRRVLKPSGVMFLNLGDGYKDKQLCMMPNKMAIRLQEDGWWLRSEIIWAKLNPMPESVTDRCTSAHEKVWMLTKSARYFWDAGAIREESVSPKQEAHNNRYVKTYPAYDERAAKKTEWKDNNAGIHSRPGPGGRNCRNVWTTATQPYCGAHFATFPPALVERCIKAGTSEKGCCAACGKPWVKVTDGATYYQGDDGNRSRKSNMVGNGHGGSGRGPQNNLGASIAKTLGWSPSCECDDPIIPARILDPFAGAGTTGLVADRLGRDCTLIDLNTSYISLAVDRIKADAGMFAEFAVERAGAAE